MHAYMRKLCQTEGHIRCVYRQETWLGTQHTAGSACRPLLLQVHWPLTSCLGKRFHVPCSFHNFPLTYPIKFILPQYLVNSLEIVSHKFGLNRVEPEVTRWGHTPSTSLGKNHAGPRDLIRQAGYVMHLHTDTPVKLIIQDWGVFVRNTDSSWLKFRFL